MRIYYASSRADIITWADLLKPVLVLCKQAAITLEYKHRIKNHPISM